MYILLLLLWIAINGACTWEIFCIGLVVTSGIYLFMCKCLEYSPSSDRIVGKNILRSFVFIGALFIEMIKSGIAVLKFILMPKIRFEPQIAVFKVGIKSEFLRTLLANAITLTPGTITLNFEGDTFYVHALDYTLAKGLQESIFVKLLTQMDQSMEEQTHD